MRTLNLHKIACLFSGLLLLGMVGCNHGGEEAVPVGEDTLCVSYSILDFYGDNTATRAVATADEKKLESLYAIFFSHNTKNFTAVKKAKITGNNFEIEVPQKNVSYDIRLVANIDQYTGAGVTNIEGWLTEQMTGKTFNDAILLATAPANKLMSPALLMHGTLENSLEYKGGKIMLYRNVAKVNVATASGIKLDASKGAYLCNTSLQTEVFSGKAHGSSNQFGQVITENNKVGTIDANNLDAIYVFPRVSTGNKDESNTCLSIWLEREDGSHKGWYRINIVGSDNRINSNYLYNVNVKKLELDGSTNPGEVFDKEPLNVVGNVDIEWSEEDVIVGDGVHWLQIRPRVMTLYKDKRSDVFEVADNFDGTEKLLVENLQAGGYFTTSVSADNKTVTVAVDDNMSGNAKVTFNIKKGNLYIPVTVEYKNTDGNEAEVGTGGDTDEGFEDGGSL